MEQKGVVFDHIVSNKGNKVDKAKVKVTEKLPPPPSVNSVRSFLVVTIHIRFFENCKTSHLIAYQEF